MSATLKTQTTQVKPEPAELFRPLDPIDAMLQGRTAQEPFLPWIVKRLRHIYPK